MELVRRVHELLKDGVLDAPCLPDGKLLRCVVEGEDGQRHPCMKPDILQQLRVVCVKPLHPLQALVTHRRVDSPVQLQRPATLLTIMQTQPLADFGLPSSRYSAWSVEHDPSTNFQYPSPPSITIWMLMMS